MNDGAHYCDKVCLESGHTKPMFKGRIDIRNSQTDLTSQKGSGNLTNMKRTFYTISTKSTGSAFAPFPDFRPGTRLAGADKYEDAVAIKKLLEQRYPGKVLTLDRTEVNSNKSREREFFVNTTSDRGSESDYITAFDEEGAIEIAKDKVYAHKVKWYTVCVYANAEAFHRGLAPRASKGFIGTRVDAADSARGSRYGA